MNFTIKPILKSISHWFSSFFQWSHKSHLPSGWFVCYGKILFASTTKWFVSHYFSSGFHVLHSFAKSRMCLAIFFGLSIYSFFALWYSFMTFLQDNPFLHVTHLSVISFSRYRYGMVLSDTLHLYTSSSICLDIRHTFQPPVRFCCITHTVSFRNRHGYWRCSCCNPGYSWR